MSKVVTVRIGDEVLAMVDQLAISRDRSRSWTVSKLVEAAAIKQLEIDAFIQVGLDDIDAGRTIPHEQIVNEILERRRQHAAA